ncbi:MAG: PD40 domain-containing protein [Kiritimatiellae bacterium]|nr:PD40 domain-containing protein [Kiritimatiellia bacterium]
MKFVALLALSAIAAVGSFAEEDWSRIYLGTRPAVSPDGQKFYFEWNDRIWSAPTAGGTAKSVSSSRCKDVRPCLSADGKRLVFASDRDGGFKVFECPVEGGKVRQVTFHSENTYPCGITPDGSNVVCVANRDNASSKGSYRIIFAPLLQRGPEKMPFDLEANDPAVSPDGSTMLFTYNSNWLASRKRFASYKTYTQVSEIWSYRFSDKKMECFIKRAESVSNPVWAPDGKSVIYIAMEKGIRNIRRRYLDGKDIGLTDFSDDHVQTASISQDGKTLVFRQGFDFWRLNIADAGSRPEKITLHPEGGYMARPESIRRMFEKVTNLDSTGDFDFCDNGMQVAFTAGGGLWVMDTEIRAPQLVDGGGTVFIRECAFTPDGSALYYLADRGDGSDIRVARRKDTSRGWWDNNAFEIKNVVSDDCRREEFSLSPDGKRMAWKDPLGQIHFAGIDGVNISSAPPCAGSGNYCWSPDGNWVAASIGDVYRNRDVWIVAVDGSREAYNVSRNFKWDGSPIWSPDGKIIAFCGERAEADDEAQLCYVYLNPKDEEHDLNDVKIEKAVKKIADNSNGEKKKAEPKKDKKEPLTIVFDGLCDRVRTVKTGKISSPFFSHDSRTIAFTSGSAVQKITVPGKLTAEKFLTKTGVPGKWIAKENRVLRLVNGHPAHGDTEFNFKAYQTFNLADYQELGFRTAWGRLRDGFYDPNFHGADWQAVRNKYLAAARNATSHSVFSRTMDMMLGELDASHLAFRTNSDSERLWIPKTADTGWTSVTAHLGLRFDSEWRGDGWKISQIIKGGPAEEASYDFAVGDVITDIDGVAVHPGDDPCIALNGPLNREMVVTVCRNGDKKSATRARVKSASYIKIRKLVGDMKLKDNRDYVHGKSNGALGYLHIDSMDMPSFYQFQQEVFSEGYGRKGLIIDVRGNGGGSTADKVLAIICGIYQTHFYNRNLGPGYYMYRWGKPVWHKPILVMCDEDSASNAEIFTHAVKSLKRGRVVGRTTGGNVISTYGNDLLDLGFMREPHIGCFTPEGIDMEFHGAVPDIEVINSPADLVQGKDTQLDTAIKALQEDVESYEKNAPKIQYQYAK